MNLAFMTVTKTQKRTFKLNKTDQNIRDSLQNLRHHANSPVCISCEYWNKVLRNQRGTCGMRMQINPNIQPLLKLIKTGPFSSCGSYKKSIRNLLVEQRVLQLQQKLTNLRVSKILEILK